MKNAKSTDKASGKNILGQPCDQGLDLAAWQSTPRAKITPTQEEPANNFRRCVEMWHSPESQHSPQLENKSQQKKTEVIVQATLTSDKWKIRLHKDGNFLKLDYKFSKIPINTPKLCVCVCGCTHEHGQSGSHIHMKTCHKGAKNQQDSFEENTDEGGRVFGGTHRVLQSCSNRVAVDRKEKSV